jgi:hypothetical protein
MNLAVTKRVELFDTDLLYEQSASHYLNILDIEGRPPKIARVVESLCEAHPHYDRTQVATWLAQGDFTTYLRGRRQRHLIERTAAKLVAAEMGSCIGVEALTIMQDRMRADPDSIKFRDLLEAAKVGMDLNASIDKDLTEATGDVKITMHLKDVLVGLPPERAAILMAEYGRAMASPKAKAEIIDASSTEEE